MRSTRAAGCYLLNVNGDDGIRVYVDGVLVFGNGDNRKYDVL
jgi:hypothetical protein